MAKIIRRANDDIRALMLEAENADDNIKMLKTKSDLARKQIKGSMLSDKIDSYIVDDDETNPKFLQASVYTSKKVTYDVEAIKNKLSKEQRKLVTKSIMVAEENGLREFIKNHPELRDEIKLFVSKASIIDEHKLGLALEHGVVTLDDIDGCYDVVESDVLKMQRVKRFELLE